MNVGHLIKKKSYEHVVYVLRRHPITFLPRLFMLFVLSLIPIALYFMMSSIFPDYIARDVPMVLGTLFGSLYYLTLLLFLYERFIVFYLDLWVVTNDRIVDVEQLGLFSRTISELDLFRIQDVTTEVHGIFATFFKYGDIHIKTASTNINIVFQNVPHPDKIRENLIRLAHEDRKHHYHVSTVDES